MPTEVDKLQRLAERVGEENADLIWKKVQETEGAFKAAGIAAKAVGGSYTEKDEEGAEEEYIDSELGELLALVGETVAETVGPAFEAMAEEIDQLRASKKERDDDKLLARISALERAIKPMAAALKELADDTPRQVKRKQRASESEDTVLTDQEAAFKGAPSQDPAVQTFDDFFSFVRGQQ